MAKRMNGTQTHSKSENLIYDGKTIDNDLDKAIFFANYFSKISSDENYSLSLIHISEPTRPY